MRICTKCGCMLNDGVSQCPRCGNVRGMSSSQPVQQCQSCGAMIPYNPQARQYFCPNCGNPITGATRYNNNTPTNKRSSVSVIVLIIVLVGVFAVIMNGIESKDSDKPDDTKTSTQTDTPKSTSAPKPTKAPTPTNTPAPTPTPDPIVGHKTSFKDLKIGDIGRVGKEYVGLQYVKSMSYLPTAFGKETVPADHEVIIGFFDIYNNTGKELVFNRSSISCYADGIQVTEVENFLLSYVDGVTGETITTFDHSFQLLTALDFEVPKGWKELKFFFKSECVWTVTSEEVSTKEFKVSPMFPLNKDLSYTKEDEIIYQGNYTIQFKGAKHHRADNYTKDNYLVFKFKLTNTGTSALETRLMGYNMRAYKDNYYIDTASFLTNEKIDGYTNIYDVDHIEPGMSANIYFAFDCAKETGNYYLIYDDGYISDHYCGYVYVEVKK